MTKISVKNLSGEKVKDLTLADSVWNIEVNNDALKKMIRLQLDATRQGTRKTKNRSEVSGGGRKPWKQKGTGRARQGSTRAPHWRHGGIVFGPHPRTYEKKMNRKERRLALKSALSYKNLDKELIVIDNFNLESNKTKDAIKVFENLKATNKTVVVVEELNENMVFATRNLSNVILLQADEINVLDIISADNMIVTESAVKRIEEVLV